MKLVVGGAFQGKKEYVKEKMCISEEEIIDGAVCHLEAIFTCTCLNQFHVWVKKAMEKEEFLLQIAERIEKENPDLILITNELGYGIVPAERENRKFRETHGRICCKMAEHAQEVHRVVCGIGTVIKYD